MKFSFFVTGMGLEHNVICIGCVQSLLEELADDKKVSLVRYSSIKKRFIMDCGYEKLGKAKKAVVSAIKQASVKSCKKFALTEIDYYDGI